MLDYQFFLGFPLDSAYKEQLNNISQPLHSLFIQNGSDEYLKQIDYENTSYLGKNLAIVTDIQSIELLEANIYSLLRRLIPHYSYEKHSLILFPVLIE